MKILLINNNPVVSRLTALSARKEDVEIDEIQEVTELSSDIYDIVFVDAESWTKDVRDVISENIRTRKSVLFYADGDEENRASFDTAILKPFLPSEVSAVIRSIEEEEVVDESFEENHFDVIEEKKASNSDELFALDGLDNLEERKEKEALKDSELGENITLEPKDSMFDEKLEEAFPSTLTNLDDDLLDKGSKVDLDISSEVVFKEVKKEEVKEVGKHEENNDERFNLDLMDELPELEEKKEEIKEVIPDKIDEVELYDNRFDKELDFTPLDDELFELDTLDEKVDKSVEEKKETQILDESEVEKIKGILTEDSSDEVTFDELITPMNVASVTPSEVEETKEVKEELEPTKSTNVDSGVLAETLLAMPVDSLRELLAGATVKIEINFPK